MNIIPAQPNWYCKPDVPGECSPIVGWVFVPRNPLVAITLAGDPQGEYHQHSEQTGYCPLRYARPVPAPAPAPAPAPDVEEFPS